MAGKLLASQE